MIWATIIFAVGVALCLVTFREMEEVKRRCMTMRKRVRQKMLVPGRLEYMPEKSIRYPGRVA